MCPLLCRCRSQTMYLADYQHHHKDLWKTHVKEAFLKANPAIMMRILFQNHKARGKVHLRYSKTSSTMPMPFRPDLNQCFFCECMCSACAQQLRNHFFPKEQLYNKVNMTDCTLIQFICLQCIAAEVFIVEKLIMRQEECQKMND